MEDQGMVIEAFTELAPTYEAAVDYELRLFWGVGYNAFVERLLGMIDIGPEDRVLDIATGTAVIPRRLRASGQAGGQIIGLDLTPEMLAKARRNIAAGQYASPPQLVCGSGMVMPLGNATFDKVICGLGTHHMDVRLLLGEVRRVMKPGGTFLMADVCATPFWRTWAGNLLLRGLIWFYSRKLQQDREEGEIAAVGLSMSKTRAQAEIEAFQHVLTSEEWQALLAENHFDVLELHEIKALRRMYPGGLLLKASYRGD